MKKFLLNALTVLILTLMQIVTNASAADYPDLIEADYVIKDFTFHDGKKLAELKIHYVTIGDPSNPAIVILHGTSGSHKNMLSEGFAGALFGAGQPLDAQRYYLIIPDAIGAGDTTKPSDGMRAEFPQYNYDDMVEAQYRLVKEGLGINHIRAVIGNSMGGMHTWLWATKYPDYMDAVIPMASLPAPMAGRNWMMRRMVIDSIRNDPEWKNGNYTEQPKNFRLANFWYGLATNGGDQAIYARSPTNKQANEWLDAQLAKIKVGDANDALYQLDASRDFDPSTALDKIKAYVLVINSADDERNPTSLGILEKALPQIAHAQAYIIPSSTQTSGHGTAGGQAVLYAEPLAQFLSSVPNGQ